MKRFLVHFKSKAGDQYVELMAKNRAEAEALVNAHQARRASRYDVTHDRLQQSFERGELTEDQLKAELERRKQDFSRYDVLTVKPNGETEFGAAESPLKIASIKEVP